MAPLAGLELSDHAASAPTTAPTTCESSRDFLRFSETLGDRSVGLKYKTFNKYGPERESSRISICSLTALSRRNAA